MKVVHLNRWDIQGGAAIAAYRQHKAVQSLGIDSVMYVREKLSDDDSVLSLDTTNLTFHEKEQNDLVRSKAESLISRNKGSIGTHLGPFSLPFAPYGQRMVKQLPQADIINLHWVSGFVGFDSFFKSKVVSAPIVWTLHDMYPFTGGCHYSGECENFIGGCGACGYISSDEEFDLSRHIHQIKMEALSFARYPLTVVAPSKWLGKQAKRSLMFKHFDVQVIPYSLDQRQFKARSKRKMRDFLNLPQDKIIAFFPSDYVTDPRKGLSYIEQAFKLLTKEEAERLMFVTIGNSSEKQNGTVEQLSLSFVKDPSLLSKYYNAADFTLLPSIEDNLPNIILESMASGTPLIAFDTGGAPDFIVDNKTGWLPKKRNVGELVDAIRTAIFVPEKVMEMGRNSIEVAKNEFTMEVQGNRYAQLYGRIKEEYASKGVA